MVMRHPLTPLIRRFYFHFYNRFAFTYDAVSAIVSRGEWRAWTRAAIPFVGAGSHVLEVAFGTGNLLIDLAGAGLAPIGVDYSPYMVEIARGKLRARSLPVRIIRAAVQHLPFPSSFFNHVVMTFPPGFFSDRQAMIEISRVLSEDGTLIWVDAPRLYPHDLWSRLLNRAYSLVGAASSGPDMATYSAGRMGREHRACFSLDELLPQDGWSWTIHTVEREASSVNVMIGSKRHGHGISA